MSQETQKEEITVTQFLDAVASGSATPGGGSVSALAGCLGSALVEMVVNLTLGKKAYEAHEDELKKSTKRFTPTGSLWLPPSKKILRPTRK